MENRRNYYRILHVQPDAPQALIKASYRTLMQHLKCHPDLGGDHWNAAVINEAYAIISDPKKRAEYDANVLPKLVKRGDKPPPQPTASKAPNTTVFCRFCKTPTVCTSQAKLGLCLECHSPLREVHVTVEQIDNQRSMQRIDKTGHLQFYTYWPQAPHDGYYTDLSPLGLRMLTHEKMYLEQIIKIDMRELKAVASVAHIQRLERPVRDYYFSVGLRFLAAEFEFPRGTFLNVEI